MVIRVLAWITSLDQSLPEAMPQPGTQRPVPGGEEGLQREAAPGQEKRTLAEAGTSPTAGRAGMWAQGSWPVCAKREVLAFPPARRNWLRTGDDFSKSWKEKAKTENGLGAGGWCAIF